jgi:hypothetical protein
MERAKLDKALEGAKEGNIRNILALRGGRAPPWKRVSRVQIPRLARNGTQLKADFLARSTWWPTSAAFTAISSASELPV